MKPWIASLLVIVALSSISYAQPTRKLDCEVVMVDVTSLNPEILRQKSVKPIGRFKVDNPGEEERVTRFFRWSKSKWFIVASLYSTDESMRSKSGADSLDLELSLSTTRTRNIRNSVSYASAEFPYGDFDVGRVTMIVHAGRRRQAIVMECLASN